MNIFTQYLKNYKVILKKCRNHSFCIVSKLHAWIHVFKAFLFELGQVETENY